MIRRRVTVRGGPVAHPVNIRVHDSDLLSSLQKPGPSFPNPALAFPALPMHQPPPERDYGFSRQKISGEALSELGARPKLLPASIAPALQLPEDDDIYHSDEDISFEVLDRKISALVGPASPGSEFRTYPLHGNKTETLLLLHIICQRN